jgi:predicted transcriptional regulator
LEDNKEVRKAGTPRDIPPPLELECLKVLWTLKQGSVKDVVACLKSADRLLAYTTVLTVLDRLHRRGAVERQKQGRAFMFVPVLDLDRARRTAVLELAATYFGGSVSSLRSYLDSMPERPGAAPEAPGRQVSEEEPRLDPTLLSKAGFY